MLTNQISQLVSALARTPILPADLASRGYTIDHLEVMLDSDIISSAWDKRVTAVEQSPWGLTDPDSEVSQFVYGALGNIYPDLVANLMRARLFGLSVAEVMYAGQGSHLVPTSVIPHRASCFDVLQDGSINLRAGGINTPIDATDDLRLKLVGVVNRRSPRYPMGVPLLSKLYYIWLISLNMMPLLVKYIERYSSPSLVGTTPYGINPVTGASSVDDLRDAMLDLVDSGVGAFQDGTAIAALKSDNSRDIFDTADQLITRRANMLILGQTLTSSNGSVGSQALGNVHRDVLQEITSGDITFVTPALQSVVDNLVEINYPGTVAPTIMVDYPSKLNTARAERDKILYDCGARFTPSYLIDQYGFSKSDLLEIKANAT